jgi:predicted chitinase
MIERGITGQAEASAFLAQVLHESGRLRWFEELGSGAQYEGRRDLGNVQSGDGRRFKGRGPIQLTGRANYRWAGGRLGLPLEVHPEMASDHSVGWRIAALYWQANGLSTLARRGAFDTITLRINGGTNGAAERRRLWRVCLRHDCRPRDQWAGYTTAERRWIREYDRLQAAATAAAADRRRALRTVMTRQRKAIWRAARATGWERSNRRRRYRSLMARTR